MKRSEKVIITTGAIIPLLFWITTIISAAVIGNYNHFTGRVSNPGAVGTPSQ